MPRGRGKLAYGKNTWKIKMPTFQGKKVTDNDQYTVMFYGTNVSDGGAPNGGSYQAAAPQTPQNWN
jgi:hypothetical protein